MLGIAPVSCGRTVSVVFITEPSLQLQGGYFKKKSECVRVWVLEKSYLELQFQAAMSPRHSGAGDGTRFSGRVKCKYMEPSSLQLWGFLKISVRRMYATCGWYLQELEKGVDLQQL